LGKQLNKDVTYATFLINDGVYHLKSGNWNFDHALKSMDEAKKVLKNVRNKKHLKEALIQECKMYLHIGKQYMDEGLNACLDDFKIDREWYSKALIPLKTGYELTKNVMFNQPKIAYKFLNELSECHSCLCDYEEVVRYIFLLTFTMK
jgi:hypothetical protein